MTEEITVVGGGLAGCEAAWQLLQRGYKVRLFEARPELMTPAHTTGKLAEMVCSNSFRSDLLTSAAGLLKAEMRLLDSLIIAAADSSAVPAGQALAVDRDNFSNTIQAKLAEHKNFTLVHEEVCKIDALTPTIIATGPLTSEALASEMSTMLGDKYLHFFDAIAPIIAADSINLEIAFRANRYGRGTDNDYLNCPMNKEEYLIFYNSLMAAERFAAHQFETEIHFDGCLPIEEMADRGEDVLRFGPMKPVGLTDPRTGEQPYAVVQLRQDDLAAEHYNLVGFQTKMKQDEQKRVLRLIPGLEKANFVRLGQMHRNSFVNSPDVLLQTYQLRAHPQVFIAGQFSGVEGYVESAASGLAAGRYMAQLLAGDEITLLPASTAIGALGYYIANAEAGKFQPMKITFGLLQLSKQFRGPRRKKREAQSKLALENMQNFLAEQANCKE
jgi:methylenetetrahydrofolate--tRNA-(uracil-5-)-methyltransferase